MNKHTHRESAKPIIPLLDDLVGSGDGWFIKSATIDPEVGEEVVIFLRDQPSRIEQLVRCDPHLGIRPLAARNLYGHLGTILFWLSDTKTPLDPISSSIQCFDPHSEQELSVWRRLADQDHWHVMLVTGNHLRDYFYFTNERFDLDQGLNTIVERCGPEPMGDPVRARELFMQQTSVEDIMNMPSGHIIDYLVFKKSDL